MEDEKEKRSWKRGTGERKSRKSRKRRKRSSSLTPKDWLQS